MNPVVLSGLVRAVCSNGRYGVSSNARRSDRVHLENFVW